MSFFAVHPAWHNFSSLVREAQTAYEARTDMERAHHMTAALYFGVAALEAFVNEEMRAQLAPLHSEDEIIKFLRKDDILKKLKKAPLRILGHPLQISDGLLAFIDSFNEVRGELTHPKTRTPHIHKRLESIDPARVVRAAAEYIVRYREAQGRVYPYWVFGWNYLGPSQGEYAIILVNEQQFGFSLQSLGMDINPSEPGFPSPWQRRYLATFSGYGEVKAVLDAADRCEPKNAWMPYRPILCRRWWDAGHQSSCGNVTRAAIDQSLTLGWRRDGG